MTANCPVEAGRILDPDPAEHLTLNMQILRLKLTLKACLQMALESGKWKGSLKQSSSLPFFSYVNS